MLKKMPLLWGLCFLAILFIQGCGSGGSSSNVAELMSPEEAVRNIFASWKLSDTAGISVSNTGEKVVGELRPQTETSQASGTIKFKDMAGETWNLQIDKVEYLTENRAYIHTLYRYQNLSEGGLKVSFLMEKDNGAWYLSDIVTEAVPTVVPVASGIQGYITDKITGAPVADARVEAFNSGTGALAGNASTGSDGFYKILDLAAGNYYLVIGRDGFEPYTISGIVIN